jgi:hypothetical protein
MTEFVGSAVKVLMVQADEAVVKRDAATLKRFPDTEVDVVSTEAEAIRVLSGRHDYTMVSIERAVYTPQQALALLQSNK